MPHTVAAIRRSLMKPILTTLSGVILAGATLAWGQGATPSDPQIAAIVVTANQVDIDAGKLAKSKASAKEVREFAELMVKDHTAVNQSATELVRKLQVTPENSATSQSLQHGGDQNLATLKGLSGKAFDRAYVDHEVTYHQAVLDAMDNTLIPSARNGQLKA